MSDALLSPAVGGVMWAVTAGVTAYSLKKVSPEIETKKIPLMGVMGAFVFAAQMINFSIPGTGSSGHLGGGLLLSALLGPYAAFLTMLSILTIQAFFFADGGILALGANVFNLGFMTAFVAYPLIFKPMLSKVISNRRIFWASLLTAVVGLQLGAFSVVVETLLSGKTSIPFGTFLLLMQPIHLAIGIVEGLITAAVLVFVVKQEPSIINAALETGPITSGSITKTVLKLAGLALLVGIFLSWFASSHPDGLEWSLFKATGSEELEAHGKIHETMADLQGKTAILPDYSFKADMSENEGSPETESPAWPQVSAGTSIAGLVGGLITFFIASLLGLFAWFIRKSKKIKGEAK
jgi:cobalt/nickel transport system permease protein